MRFNKTLTTTLTTLGTVLSLGAVACADNVITVKPGDTLSTIANTSRTTVAQLQKSNGIQNPNEIHVGQKLKVNSSKSENNYVIVKGGDTLSKIALENGTTVAKLQEINHLANVNEIMPGQKILLAPGLQTNLNSNVVTDIQNNTQSIQSQETTKSNENLNAENNKTTTKTISNNNVKQVQAQQSSQVTITNKNQSASPVVSNDNQKASQQKNVNTQQANKNNSATPVNSSNMDSNNTAAKAWIAQHESGGNYNAMNGQYIGKYQLSSSYLHGDYSPANQEKCANEYVSNRYGNWVNAQQHWMTYGWY